MQGIRAKPTVDKEVLIRETEINLWETWSNFGRGPGCALHDEGDALWFETPIPIVPYNTILKFQVQTEIEKRIDALLARYRERQVPILWIVHPSSFPRDLPKRLERRGLMYIESTPGMARELVGLPQPPPLPDDVEVREVIAEADLNEFNELAAWRWEVPVEHHRQLQAMLRYFRPGQPGSHTRFWLAWRDGVPISKVGSYYAERSVGIYAVATKPEARGLGIASVLTVKALKAAQEAGRELAVLHSSPPAEKLYERLGFIAVTKFHLYASEATTI